MKQPKVFISYSWNPIQNRIKVLELAERLSGDSVYVVIDVWDLHVGQDKYKFMEQMVNNPDINRVLIICNKDYAEKANFRRGGVGIESLIISDEIYNSADQTKFIPVIFEFDENKKPHVPTFVNSRIFIDLSSDEVFEENYEKLLRNIFDKPVSKRPPLGTIPAFLQIDEPVYLPTAHKVTAIKNALINEKKNTPLLIQDYLDVFVNSLSQFEIKDDELFEVDYDEVVLKKIEELRVLRDDFTNFLEIYLSNSLELDIEKLHAFFEKLISYLNNREEYYNSYNNRSFVKNDHYRFFYHELFLTFTAIMLKNERFSELAYILQTPFIVEIKDEHKLTQCTFSVFRRYSETLNVYRKKRLNSNRISIVADTLKQRATEKYNFDSLKEADLLLSYISLLFPDNNSYTKGYWFPETSCYWHSRTMVLPKTVSERYFNKVKVLFGVKNKEELVSKVNEVLLAQKQWTTNFEYHIPDIKRGLAIEDMCTLK